MSFIAWENSKLDYPLLSLASHSILNEYQSIRSGVEVQKMFLITGSFKFRLQPIQFSSVTQSCLTLCDPVNCSTPGLPVHQLPESTQTYVHWVGDAIQPSHPLSSPSPPSLNLSQHQGLFQWVSSWHQVAKILELQLQPSVLPMNIKGCFPLGSTCLTSLPSNGLSGVVSRTTAQKHQFFGAQPSLWSISHIHVWASHFNSLLEEGIKQALGTFRKSLHCTNAETPPNPPQQFHSCIKAWIAPW